MKNIGEQQIIIECPNTIFHLYIDSEDELSKVKVFMNNMKNVDSISLHDIYNWCNRQPIEGATKPIVPLSFRNSGYLMFLSSYHYYLHI